MELCYWLKPVDIKGDKQRNRVKKENICINIMHKHNFMFTFFTLFLCLSPFTSTGSAAPSSHFQDNTHHNSYTLFNEGPTLKMSAHAFQSFYSGEI